jgi:hypothetical protein
MKASRHAVCNSSRINLQAGLLRDAAPRRPPRAKSFEEVSAVQRSIPIALVLALMLMLTASVGVTSAGLGARALAVKVVMTGDQEATPTCSPPEICGDPDASGIAKILVIPANDMICWQLSWSNVDGDVVAAHIHLAPAGVPGPVVVPLSVRPPSGCTTSAVADAIAADPSAYYVNVHSTVYPMGAIRAQLG